MVLILGVALLVVEVGLPLGSELLELLVGSGLSLMNLPLVSDNGAVLQLFVTEEERLLLTLGFEMQQLQVLARGEILQAGIARPSQLDALQHLIHHLHPGDGVDVLRQLGRAEGEQAVCLALPGCLIGEE